MRFQSTFNYGSSNNDGMLKFENSFKIKFYSFIQMDVYQVDETLHRIEEVSFKTYFNSPRFFPFHTSLLLLFTAIK